MATTTLIFLELVRNFFAAARYRKAGETAYVMLEWKEDVFSTLAKTGYRM